MSFNGSGTFLINSTGQPVVANTVISATVFNALTADLASGLTNCITKDGQSTPTANIPMGSNKITGLANGTLINDAATLGQVQTTAAKLITSVSGVDTVTGIMSPTLTAYAAGQLFYFVAAGANTGAVTLNIDGLGAKAVTRDGSTALAAGDINSGEMVVVIYDGTRFQMINAANSFGNTTINGTLTVTGNTGLQANVSITSTLSVGGTFAVTGAATLGSTLAVTGKSDLPTVSTASMNAAVALITTGTVTNLTATGASIASANIGNLQFTAASIASINAGVAVVTNLTATSASIASANVGTAVITTGTVTNLTSTSASVASANAAVALVTTGTVTNLTSTAASIASANLGTAVVTNLAATSASVASVNAGVALVTNGTVTNLTSTSASIGSANFGAAVISSVTLTGASIASVNIGNAVITGASIASMNGAVANITTVNATTVDATNVEVTNVKAKDGTAAIVISDTSGNVRLSNYVGVGGGADSTTSGLVSYKMGTNAVAYGVHGYITVPATATTQASLFHTWLFTAANGGTPYTLPSVSHYRTQQVTINADSTINNQFGFYAVGLTGATNNYGFYSDIASGTNRWNFYAAGTADNYFGGPTTISVNSSSAALRVTQTGTGNALLVEDASGDASPFVINASGNTIVGFSSAITTRIATTSVTPVMQVFDAGSGAYCAFRFAGASASPAVQFFAKSRSGTVGTTGTVVVDGDGLMRISAAGDDGTQFTEAGRIEIQVDGTPGTNDMPGRLLFSTTADGAATPTEKMRIDNAGNVVVNTAAIATTATNGFLYVPSCAGTPTGTPTTYTGRVPIVVDTTNHKLYFYSGGTWRDAGP